MPILGAQVKNMKADGENWVLMTRLTKLGLCLRHGHYMLGSCMTWNYMGPVGPHINQEKLIHPVAKL